MLAILYAFRKLAIDLLKSRSRLEAENLLLRHQLNVPTCITNTSEYNFRKEQQSSAAAFRTM